jgi:hypothetical protein
LLACHFVLLGPALASKKVVSILPSTQPSNSEYWCKSCKNSILRVSGRRENEKRCRRVLGLRESGSLKATDSIGDRSLANSYHYDEILSLLSDCGRLSFLCIFHWTNCLESLIRATIWTEKCLP